MTCSDPLPLGEYGGDSYGCGTLPCSSGVVQAGYGGGSASCMPTSGLNYLVGTITKLGESMWVGHRTGQYGGGVFQATSYPECKRQVSECVAQPLKEQVVERDGVPMMVYLRLRYL